MSAELRSRFRKLHVREQLFVMPNPWDVGSARLLEACGFEAIATTSAGFAWSLGKLDQHVSRDELVRHVASLTAATTLPLNVDSERCFPDEPGGIGETVRLLSGAGAAGCSIEDYDPASGTIEPLDVAVEHVATAVEAARDMPEPLVLTARAENHLHGVDDLDDTIARLVAYGEAGADALYAPGLVDLEQIGHVVDAVQAPLNVLALPSAPPIADLESVGVRRVSTGSLLARSAYGVLLTGGRELLEAGTSRYAEHGAPQDDLRAAFADD